MYYNSRCIYLSSYKRRVNKSIIINTLLQIISMLVIIYIVIFNLLNFFLVKKGSTRMILFRTFIVGLLLCTEI